MKNKVYTKNLIVPAGDLWHGCQDIDSGRHYYPQLTAEVYDETFRVLDKNPEATDEELPMTEVWDEMLVSIFGKRPTDADHLDAGKGWQWKYVRERLRSTHKRLRKRGFNLKHCTELEMPTVRMSSEGKICVIQGNKRLSLVRTKEGLDHPIPVRMVPTLGDWDDFKLKVYPPGKKKFYHLLGHPDTEDWEKKGTVQPCWDRWKMFEPIANL